MHPSTSRSALSAALAHAFDRIEAGWESSASRRATANGLVVLFIGTLVAVQARRWGLLPPGLAGLVPASHFAAIGTAFTALLLVETISLVLALVDSVAGSVGKQVELFSLILLRDAFKMLGTLGEPVVWTAARTPVVEALFDGTGAMLVFAGVVMYNRLQRHRPITQSPGEQAQFVHAKKMIALGLLVALAVAGVDDLRRYATGADPYPFFDSVFTSLIFADVLLVLVSLRYSSTYAVVFRNSGFALATVLLRLALVAPPVPGVALGVGATALLVALAWLYNRAAVAPSDASHVSAE